MSKNIFIMGDSYSTFGGYIPEGYACYYGIGRENVAQVSEMGKTWWGLLAKEMDYNVVMNDSYSGSTVCTSVRDGQPITAAFVKRLDKYIEEGFFEKNPIDTFFVFGGTNDNWLGRPMGETLYEGWNEENLKCILPAFCYLLDRLTKQKNIGRVVVIFNTALKPVLVDGVKEACERLGADYIQLSNIEKDFGHPNETGMAQIAQQLGEFLSK